MLSICLIFPQKSGSECLKQKTYLGNLSELEKTKTTKFLLMQGYFSKAKLDNSLFYFKVKTKLKFKMNMK